MKIFGISPSLADLLFTASNVMLVLGAIFAVVGTIGTVYAGGIRERYADERISENEAKTARALSDAASANARAAALDKEAALLKVELAKRTQPLVARTISDAQAAKLKEILLNRELAIGFTFPTTDAEVISYAESLRGALVAAGVRIGMSGGAGSVISSGGKTLIGKGLSLIGGNDPLTNLIATALQQAGIPFEKGTSLPGIAFGMPILVVGSRPPLHQQNRSN